MIQPYKGSDPAVKRWSEQVVAEFKALEGLLQTGPQRAAFPPQETEKRDGFRPAQTLTLSGNLTLTRSMLNTVYVLIVSAARDCTLPAMNPGEWVVVVNDGTSTNDVTVKDSLGNTVTSVTPGSASGEVQADSSGAGVPI